MCTSLWAEKIAPKEDENLDIIMDAVKDECDERFNSVANYYDELEKLGSEQVEMANVEQQQNTESASWQRFTDFRINNTEIGSCCSYFRSASFQSENFQK